MSEGSDYYGIVMGVRDPNEDDVYEVAIIDDMARKRIIVAGRKFFKMNDFEIGDVVVFHIHGRYRVHKANYKGPIDCPQSRIALLAFYLKKCNALDTKYAPNIEETIENLGKLDAIELELWSRKFGVEQE